MRRISSASSPCSREEMSRLSLKDLPRVSRLFRNLSRRNPEKTSALTRSMVTFSLAQGIKAVQESVKKESGKDFCLDKKYGYIHSCPTNLGTGMRASVHVDLPGWTKVGLDALQRRCEELHLQPRGTRGESGGQTGHTYDISKKHRLGYSEVELVQKMIDGVNTLWKEDQVLKKKH